MILTKVARLSALVRSVFLALSVLAGLSLMGGSTALARDASGKGSPEYGASHTTPHGVKPGRGISGKPEEHGKGGTAHVPGPKGGSHDDEGHDQTEGGHDGGTGHVPGGKGGGGQAGSGGHADSGGHEEGEEHEEGHTPGPKPGGGHEEGSGSSGG